jgi:uncharacterized protein (TIGR02117 family)
MLRKIVRVLAYTSGAVVGVAAAYVAVAVAVSRITVPKQPTDEVADIPVFLYSNGVHTDLVMPVKTNLIDWSLQVRYAHTLANDPTYPYVGIGWGDKGFYLDTPTWADLKVSTALRAAFWLSSSAMHATFYREADLATGDDCIALRLTHSQYAQLVAYIQASFRHDAAGQVELIFGHSYGRDDAFYEAHRVYSIFYTCNTWANNGLKISGQKACLWTPMESSIMRLYRQK